MFCPLPGQHGAFPLFCQSKKFSTKCVYTFRKQPVIFQQVENSVESVQKSSRSACFPGGIKQFPPGFQQQVPPYPGKSLTICKIQVGIMTVFWTGNCPLLQFPPTSFWRMLKYVENPCRFRTRRMLQRIWIFVVKRRAFLPQLHQPLCAVTVPQQLYARKSACSDWF